MTDVVVKSCSHECIVRKSEKNGKKIVNIRAFVIVQTWSEMWCIFMTNHLFSFAFFVRLTFNEFHEHTHVSNLLNKSTKENNPLLAIIIIV